MNQFEDRLAQGILREAQDELRRSPVNTGRLTELLANYANLVETVKSRQALKPELLTMEERFEQERRLRAELEAKLTQRLKLAEVNEDRLFEFQKSTEAEQAEQNQRLDKLENAPKGGLN